MVWQMHTIRIVVRVVGGANHKMIAGHVISSGCSTFPTGDRDVQEPYVLTA